MQTEYFLRVDYKYILIMLGLNSATGNYSCAWCTIHKDDRWKMDHEFNYFNSPPLTRTLQDIKEMSKSRKNNGCCWEPLSNIELDHIVVDEFHLLLRITNILTANLITVVTKWHIEENSRNKVTHLNKLVSCVRSTGMSFMVSKKKNADGKESNVHD